MDEIITIVRALAISNAANGITVAQLNKDFKNLEGYSIPYRNFGFQSLDAMLRAMTDAVRVNGYGLTAVVQPLTNEKSQHVQEMVKKSKNTSKKPIHTYHPPPRRPSPVRASYNKIEVKAPVTTFTHFTANNGMQQKPAPTVDMKTFQADIEEEMRKAERQINALKAIQNTEGQRRPQFNGKDEQRKFAPVVSQKPVPTLEKNLQKNITNERISSPAPKVPENKTMSDVIVRPVVSSKNVAPEMQDEFAKQSLANLSIPDGAMSAKDKVVEGTLLPTYLKPKTVVKAMVTSALNPKHLHVHLLEHVDRLLRLAPHIDTLYRTKAAGDEWLVSEAMVQVGLYCAAKYYNRWYRAKIMSPLNHGRVLVLHIDYGYLRYIPLRNVRFLARELATIPPQVLQVSLEYLHPVNGTWSDACCDHLATLVHRKVLDMVIVNTKHQDNTLDVILTSAVNDSPVDLLIRNPDESTLNRQLALRSDIIWSMED